MRCPHCNARSTRVVDSRSTEQGQAVRRRRSCDRCAQRFTTYERIEEVVPVALHRSSGSASPRVAAVGGPDGRRRRGTDASVLWAASVRPSPDPS